MTTPGPEPDPRWDVQAAVPGWSLGQDFYTGPIYDDSGWHLDLSDVDWGQNAKGNPRAGTAPAPPATFRYERNVVTPAPAGYERSPGPLRRAPPGGTPGTPGLPSPVIRKPSFAAQRRRRRPPRSAEPKRVPSRSCDRAA